MKQPAMMLVLVMGVAAGCTLSSKATDFSGLASGDSAKPMHMNMTNYALHLVLTKPLVGDATLQKTVADFTHEAKQAGASKVRIVQSDEWKLWWILPPISILVTPVVTNVAGDALP